MAERGVEVSLQVVANNLGVDPSTVSRVVSLFKATGSVQKRLCPKDARPNKKLSKTVQLIILHTVLQQPGIYLRELQMEVLILSGVDISVSLLCTFLHSANFMHQRMQIVAKQQDKELREQFAVDVSLYKLHMLVFVDEIGSDCQDAMKRYGYSLRSRPPRSCRFLVRGERISVITAMTEDGISAMKFVTGTVSGDEFLDFIERDLLPTLVPFDRINVILDNCSVHHVPGVVSVITEIGALVHFLPPYSPDMNPIGVFLKGQVTTEEHGNYISR